MKDLLALDRKTKGKTIIKGYHLYSKIQLRRDGNKIVPLNPTHIINKDLKTLEIYCREESVTGYTAKIKKDLIAKNILNDDWVINSFTEFKENDPIAFYFSEGNDNINDELHKGLIKIATEYAYDNGIPRDQLSNTLDHINNNLIYSNCVIPFIPITEIDKFWEKNRFHLEANFPTHTLLLYSIPYTDSTELVCYIDLFSTFQFYVILNENYQGKNIDKEHYQSIITIEKKDVDLSKYSYKELFQFAKENKIDFPSGTHEDEIKKHLTDEFTKKSNEYKLNLSNELQRSLDYLLPVFIEAKMKNSFIKSTNTFNPAVQYLKTLSKDEKQNLLFEIQSLLDESVNTEFYRKKIRRRDGDCVSKSDEIREVFFNKKDNASEYGHLKFTQFSYFVQKMIKKSL